MNQCMNCGVQCIVKFCTRSCNISFQNKHRNTSFRLDLKHAKCVKCHQELYIKKQQSPNKAKCQQCKLTFIKRYVSKTKTCSDCQQLFTTKNGKFCLQCLKIRRMDAGRKSAALQALTRRSWSEIELGKLCQVRFSHVSFNDPIFPNDPPTKTHWDADILIHEYRVAILWNGPWHYRKLRFKHNVEQVQQRDQIKINRIIAAGWHPLIIKDEQGQKDLNKIRTAFDEIIALCSRIHLNALNSSLLPLQ